MHDLLLFCRVAENVKIVAQMSQGMDHLVVGISITLSVISVISREKRVLCHVVLCVERQSGALRVNLASGA